MHLMSAKVKLTPNLVRADFGIFHHSLSQNVDKAPVLKTAGFRYSLKYPPFSTACSNILLNNFLLKIRKFPEGGHSA